jgi:hypothetical protein
MFIDALGENVCHGRFDIILKKIIIFKREEDSGNISDMFLD